MDKKERFISFFSQDIDEENDSVEFACHALRGKGFGVSRHDSYAEAVEHAKQKYHYEDNDEKRQEQFTTIRDRFPYFTASEWESFQVLDALYHTGKVMPIRGRYNDQLVMVFASVAHGVDEIRVTPLAIVVNEFMEGNLELPFENDEED
jgi:hypothetical protein